MNKFHTILLDQASRTVLKNLSVFVKEDINNVKDYRGHFLKVSENFDNALIKNSQANKGRQQEVQEAANILSATKSCFQHTALDYVNYITLVQARKVPSILSTVSVSYFCRKCNDSIFKIVCFLSRGSIFGKGCSRKMFFVYFTFLGFGIVKGVIRHACQSKVEC